MKEKNKIKNITVTEDQLHWMFRYCLSRKSYAVADGAEAIRSNWQHISLNGQQMIKKEIRNVYDMLTDDDRAIWATVLALDTNATASATNKKTYWEYRVVVRELPCYDTVPTKNFVWGVHEVYFENGVPTLCTELPTYPMSEDSMEDLQRDMTRYAGAMLLPVINYSVFADAERATRRRAGALDSVVGQQLNEGGVGSEK